MCQNAASVGNKWPELKFRILDVDVVALTDVWLQPGEGDNGLTEQEYSFFRTDTGDR